MAREMHSKANEVHGIRPGAAPVLDRPDWTKPTRLITMVLAGIAVADIDAAGGWYERLMGRPADSIPMPSLTEWFLTGGGELQLSLDVARAVSSSVTVGVDDVDAHVAELEERGLTLEAADTTSGMFRIAAAIDPDGNAITFSQDLRAAP